MSSSRNWIDWSHKITPGMQTFPAGWHRPVSFETLGTHDSVGRKTSQIHIGTHSGTHVDAPSHFMVGGMNIDDFACDYFIGQSVVLDFSAVGPNRPVGSQAVAEALGQCRPGLGVILFFNWSRLYGQTEFYSEQPFLEEDAAEILASLEPKFVGYDLAMPDNPANGRASECDSPIHKIFLSRGIPLVESLRIPEEHPTSIDVMCVPLNLDGLDGSPVRFLAKEAVDE